MRLIDLEKVVFDCSGLAYIDPLDFRKTAEYFMRQLKEQPTIEPEWKKGKWLQDVAYYDEEGCPCIVSRCDQCGEPNPETNFCPKCGADMRGES